MHVYNNMQIIYNNNNNDDLNNTDIHTIYMIIQGKNWRKFASQHMGITHDPDLVLF